MKIIGMALLLLGIYSGITTLTGDSQKSRRSNSPGYDKGYRAGRIAAPILLVSVGIWCLLRGRAVRDGVTAASATTTGTPPVLPRRLSPILLGGLVGVGVIGLAMVLLSVTRAHRLKSRAEEARAAHEAQWRALNMRNERVQRETAPDASPFTRPGDTRRDPTAPASETPPRTGGRTRPVTAPNRLATAREAAPVPEGATRVDVHWGNRWWPGTIVRRTGERAYIHYDGWSTNSDEWVGPDRLRPRQ